MVVTNPHKKTTSSCSVSEHIAISLLCQSHPQRFELNRLMIETISTVNASLSSEIDGIQLYKQFFKFDKQLWQLIKVFKSRDIHTYFVSSSAA